MATTTISNPCTSAFGTSAQSETCNDSQTLLSNTTYCVVSINSIYDCWELPTQTAQVATSTCFWCAPASSTSGSSTALATSNGVAQTNSVTSPPTTSTSHSTTNTDNTSSSKTISASPTQTSKALSSPATVPQGNAIGIGIGCAIAGASLAGLIFFFLFRRKDRQRGHRNQDFPSNGGGYVEQEKRNMVATRPHAKGGLVTNVDRLLSQPAEDDVIIGGLSKLRDSIKNHVQNYYHNAPVAPEMVDETRLVDLARVMAVPTSAVLDLLLNPATRMPMIRLFVGHLILSRCIERADGAPSFLPNEVSALAASYTQAADTTAAQVALFSKWKTISGTLIQQRYSQQPDENDPRAGSITQAVAAAEPILHPFINPSIDTNARCRNLEGIMRRAAQYAFLLFSQPSSYSFDYSGTGQSGSLVVFPALLQTVNDEAEVLSPPRVLSEKEAVTGLGI